MTTPSPIDLEMIVDRQRPSSPRLSPGGRQIAVTVSYASKADDRPDSSIWMIREGREPFRFSGGLAGASEPAWSPDGIQLVFTSTRDHKDKKDEDKAGLFVIPVDGGEAAQIGNVHGKLSAPLWSPDGGLIAYLMVDPDTEGEVKRKEDKRDHVVFEDDAHHQRLWVIDPESGKARCLTTGARSVHDYCWSPDGEQLIAVTTPLPTINSLFGPTDLIRLPVSGGLATTLATFPMSPGSPVVRNVDGERVVAVIANDHRADPTPSIWTVPCDGGQRRQLLPDLRGAVQDLIADPTDPSQLIALIVEGTHGRLFRVSASTGEREAIAPAAFENRGSIAEGISASRDGRTAFVWSASDVPHNVWSIEPNGDASKLTSFGDEFDGMLARGETVRWQSFDGVEIEGTLVRPKDVPTDTPLPLFVEIHGGPAWQWEDAASLSWHDWAQMLASRGWAVLLPNPRGSTGYGSAFEKLLQDDVGNGESKDLIAAAEAMVERGIADPDRLAIGGWSWGGYLTARTITQTRRFRAGVTGAGVANLTSDHGAGDIAEYNRLLYPGHPYDAATWDYYARGTPIRLASEVTTPTLILHGDTDDRVHPTQGQEFYRALQVSGVPVRFVRYPREGHSIRERAHQLDLMERICAWLDRWVPAN
jgi:dipeptidyl aminopeptidase/acylaminoacyl peptidase